MERKDVESKNIELYSIVHPEASLRELERAKSHILLLLSENGFPMDRPVTILDAGCGGRFAGLHFYSELDIELVFVCDINRDFVKQTESKAKEMGINCKGYNCSLEKLPLDDMSVDLVHCNGVLNHVWDQESVLGELKRVLRPGGYLLLGCYGYGGLLKHVVYPLLAVIRRNIAIHQLARLVRYMGPLKSPDYSLLDLVYAPIQRLYTKEKIRNLLDGKFHHISINKSFKRVFNIPLISSMLFGFGYMYIIAKRD